MLTPDATQLADPNWRPQPCALPSSAAQGRWEGAAAAAREGRINELCLMTVDVLAAPADGKERWAVCWGVLKCTSAYALHVLSCNYYMLARPCSCMPCSCGTTAHGQG